jgi:signal transduction histidine kinase
MTFLRTMIGFLSMSLGALVKRTALFGIRLLTKHTILLLAILLISGFAAALFNMSNLSSDLIQSQAIQSSALYAQAIKEARTLYSKNVVTRVKEVPGIHVITDYNSQLGGIPLPATYLIELSKSITDQNPGMSLRLYSDYPFPSRVQEGGARDDFEKTALEYLRRHPTESFVRFENFQGRPSLRYAEADIMKPSCVACHNTDPNSPKRDWKVGDVRGVVEINRFLDSFMNQTRAGLSRTFSTLGGLLALSLVGIALVITRLRQTSEEMELQVIDRTLQLRQTNEELLEEKIKVEQSALQAQEHAQQLGESEAQLNQKAQALQQSLQELQSIQVQLVQSEKMSSLGQLVAGIAHEINNPISFIHGNLNPLDHHTQELLNVVKLYQQHYPDPVSDIQVMAEEIDLEFLQEDLTKIITSMKIGTDRICQIVLSLRNFSRMDEAAVKSVSIHEGIDSTLMILQHRLNPHSNSPAIEVIKDYGNLPPVECYPGQLNQVFMNLLANAIDTIEEDRAQRTFQENNDRPSQITIQTSILDNQWVEISIADNGKGIPQQIQNRIFDPFFTTKEVGKGTGMGLSISYQIITENHYGKLECLSNPNQGTKFSIQIPIQRQPLRSV